MDGSTPNFSVKNGEVGLEAAGSASLASQPSARTHKGVTKDYLLCHMGPPGSSMDDHNRRLGRPFTPCYGSIDSCCYCQYAACRRQIADCAGAVYTASLHRCSSRLLNLEHHLAACAAHQACQTSRVLISAARYRHVRTQHMRIESLERHHKRDMHEMRRQRRLMLQ